jgi:hypothetical protein
MIIGILGNKGHGKDTISDHLSSKYNFHKRAFAGPLKEICKILFGFNDEQLYGNLKETLDKYWGVTPRNMFQFVGTDLLRNKMSEIIPEIHHNFWLECMRRKSCEYDRLVISDVRFQNEVDFIHEMNGIVIKVERGNKCSNDVHVSESEMLKIINYDLYIKNDSDLESLYSKIDDICLRLKISPKESNFDKYVLGC